MLALLIGRFSELEEQLSKSDKTKVSEWGITFTSLLILHSPSFIKTNGVESEKFIVGL